MKNNLKFIASNIAILVVLVLSGQINEMMTGSYVARTSNVQVSISVAYAVYLLLGVVFAGGVYFGEKCDKHIRIPIYLTYLIFPLLQLLYGIVPILDRLPDAFIRLLPWMGRIALMYLAIIIMYNALNAIHNRK